jgi:hypothetical protein
LARVLDVDRLLIRVRAEGHVALAVKERIIVVAAAVGLLLKN